jgi:acetylornithine deacetylase/succinyl-diaminopimelate desuccinylase-like protein
MDFNAARHFTDRLWDDSILPTLVEYVRIPNLSPAFDPDWEKRGHMERAITLLADWCRAHAAPGMKVEVHRVAGLSPVLLVDIPGEVADCVLLYGHLDKQPEFTGWLPGLGPWEPVIRDRRLYGRGGADDGYAVFSSLAAILALKALGLALPRCVVLIEASEESGSVHLPGHLQALGERLGTPSLVVCLDAECGNYEQFWGTTSLRGLVSGRLRVRVLSEGVHSGMGTGIAPAPFRIASQLLARIENPISGEILLDALRVPIPAGRMAQMRAAAAALGPAVAGKMPFVPGARPVSNDPFELLVNTTWRATLAVTGADGLPPIATAGNVLLPEITLKLSVRIPPTCDAKAAAEAVRAALEHDPPHGAEVRFEGGGGTGGWNAPALAPWLEQAIEAASQSCFGREALHVGAGGSIPFLGMLAERFPGTQFLVTGVLGPQSNAHGPNEFLHIDYAKKLTTAVAGVLAAHARRAG